MKAITTIKRSIDGTFTIYNSKDELIATASKVEETSEHYGFLEYRVCLVGGPAHGKIGYAVNWENLNDMSVEIAKLHG